MKSRTSALLTLVIAALTALSPLRLVADTIVFRQNTSTAFFSDYRGTDDTILDSDNPSLNYGLGTSATDQIGILSPTKKALLRFNLASFAGSYTTINSVTLTLHLTSVSAGGGTITAYTVAKANANWVEGTGRGTVKTDTAAWGYRYTKDPLKDSNLWAGSAGLSTETTDYAVPALASVAVTASGAHTFTFTGTAAALKTLIDQWSGTQTSNAGLLLTTDATELRFVTSDAYTNDSATPPPTLTIDYVNNAPESVTSQIVYQAGLTNALVTTTAYTGVDDATLRSDNADANYGLGGAAINPTTARGLLRFDLGSLSGKYSRINSVTLELDATVTGSVPGGTVSLHPILTANGSWVEGTANGTAQTGSSAWNFAKNATQAWSGSAGLSTAGTDYDATPLATASYTGSGTVTLTFDRTPAQLTTYVGGWRGSSPGLLLLETNPARNGTTTFYESEGTVKTRSPKLTLNYTNGPLVAVSQLDGTALARGTSTVNFGWGEPGKAATTRTFLIRNDGNAPLNSLAVSVSGTHAGDFVATAPAITRLAAGASTPFTITFTPGAASERSATLTITSTDTASGPFTFALAGRLTADAPTALETQTLAQIRAWGALAAGNGSEGRPLPLAASWSVGMEQYAQIYSQSKKAGDPVHAGFVLPLDSGPSPWRFVKMIKEGSHMMITFQDITDAAGSSLMPEQLASRATFQAMFDAYYRPAMEYARAHKLPIAIRGWNWAQAMLDTEGTARGRPTNGTDTAKLIKKGAANNSLADPFGPAARWEEFGRFWMGHELMKKLQEFYPDPPMVVFLNNHEAGLITTASQIDDTCDRYVALHGTGKSEAYRAVAIRDGYAELHKKLFAAARAAFVEPKWRDNARFVAYNNTAPAILGRNGGNSTPTIGFDPVTGYTEHRNYDGGMPEYYDNMWQAPTKSDSGPWSPQVEASNLIAYQDAKVWAENPNFYWSSVIWGGDFPTDSLTSRPGRYITDDEAPKAKWDMDRYTGMVQFGLWMMRPRDYREFRGADDLRGFGGLTFDSLVTSVDRVWKDTTLTEFWRFGKLVYNPVFDTKGKHYFGGGTDWPQWLKDMERWFLLTSSANSVETTWPWYGYLTSKDYPIKVFAMALRLGDAPSRRWLIYAHAPLGAVAGSTVTLPGRGTVTLDYISKSGSFFIVDEAANTVTPYDRGGPGELGLTSTARHIVAGGSVTVTPELRHPAATAITGYTWKVPGQSDRTSASLAAQTFTFATEGEYLVTLEAATSGGTPITEQTAVWVRPAAPETGVVMDLPLRTAYSLKGPWGTDLKSGDLRTFQYLPNASTSYDRDPVLLGGTFVNDTVTTGGALRPVLEVKNATSGVLIPRSLRTILNASGYADLGISFRFKAENVQRRQLLYSQGTDLRPGISIYLEGGKLYAGSWVMNSITFGGEWISTDVAADQWYQVNFTLRDAEKNPKAGVASLFVNGSLVGTASAARLPLHYGNPKLNLPDITGRIRTATCTSTTEDSDKNTEDSKAGRTIGAADFFVGRLADFTFTSGTSAFSAQRYLHRALNVGGSAITGASGLAYEADAGSSAGTAVELPATQPYDADNDADIYRTYRTGAAFDYAFAVPNGDYTVRLKFLEPTGLSPARRFHVDLQGTRVLTDYDLQAAAGLRKSLDRSFDVTVSNGQLTLALTGTSGDAVLSGIVIEKRALTTTGLIGHWRMDETTTSTAFDTSGKDRDVSLISPTTRTDGLGLSGAALPQGRTEDKFSIGTGNALTASIWVRPVGMAGRAGTIVFHGDDKASFRIALDNQLRLVTEIDTNGPTPLTATRPLTENRWYHVAMVYDGSLAAASRVRLYIDGALDKTADEASATLPVITGRLYLGQKTESDKDPKFTGNLRDLRLITAALTATEIETLASKPPLGASTSFFDTPYTPEKFTATPASLTRINLSWLPVRGALSYTVKRASTSGGPYSTLASGLTTTTYADTDLTPGATYFYVITATSVGGESTASSELAATAVPEVIVDNTDTGFTVGNSTTGTNWGTNTSGGAWYGTNYRADSTSTADADTRWAQWTPTIPLVGTYQVYMNWPAANTRPDAAPVEIVHATGTDSSQTVDQTLNNNTWMSLGTYAFAEGSTGSVRIFATDAGSTAADAVKFVFVPLTAPTGLTATTSDDNATQVVLSWTDRLGNRTGYSLERKTGDTGTYALLATPAATATTYTDTTAKAATTYVYRLRETRQTSSSAPSAEATATTPTALSAWRNQHFSATELADADKEAATWGHTADPDGDGVNNLLEYALGGDPLQSGTGILPVVSVLDGKLQLTFTRTRSDVTYTVEATSDLKTWTTIATNPGTVGESVTVADTVTLAANPKRFLRLKATPLN